MASVLSVPLLWPHTVYCTEKIFQRQVTKIGLSNCQWHHPSDRVYTDFVRRPSPHGKCKTITLELLAYSFVTQATAGSKADSFTRSDVSYYLIQLNSEFNWSLASRHLPHSTRHTLQYPRPLGL